MPFNQTLNLWANPSSTAYKLFLQKYRQKFTKVQKITLYYILHEREGPGWTSIPKTIPELTAGLGNRKLDLRAERIKRRGTKPTLYIETLVQPQHTNPEQLLKNKTTSPQLSLIVSKQVCKEERSGVACLFIFPYITTATCKANLSAGKTNINYTKNMICLHHQIL